MRDRDDYRSMYIETLLQEARETGINPDMAVVLAEKLEAFYDVAWHYEPTGAPSMGGRYFFNERSEA